MVKGFSQGLALTDAVVERLATKKYATSVLTPTIERSLSSEGVSEQEEAVVEEAPENVYEKDGDMLNVLVVEELVWPR